MHQPTRALRVSVSRCFESLIIEFNMKHKRFFTASVFLLLAFVGWESSEVNVRALPTPAPEQPPANIPISLHQRNWTGPLGQGSCVHASLVNHLRWLNAFELGERCTFFKPHSSSIATTKRKITDFFDLGSNAR